MISNDFSFNTHIIFRQSNKPFELTYFSSWLTQSQHYNTRKNPS